MKKNMKDKSSTCPTFDFDIKHLETFCVVVELSSFSRAAEKLLITQASASERIAKLEKAVGVRLLDRLGRKIVPSQVGKVLYQNARKLVDMKKQTCQELEDFLGIKRGEIFVGGSTIPGEYILPGLIGSFYKKQPNINVHLEIGDTSVVINGVFDGAYELGVVGSRDDNECLEFKKLWQDKLVLIVSNNHHLANKKSVTIKDIIDEPFIMRERGSGTRKILDENLIKQHGISLKNFKITAQLGSSTAVKEGVRRNLGISFISMWSIENECKTGMLKALAVKDFEVTRYFYLVHDKRRAISPICAAFREFLLEQAKSQQ